MRSDFTLSPPIPLFPFLMEDITPPSTQAGAAMDTVPSFPSTQIKPVRHADLFYSAELGGTKVFQVRQPFRPFVQASIYFRLKTHSFVSHLLGHWYADQSSSAMSSAQRTSCWRQSTRVPRQTLSDSLRKQQAGNHLGSGFSISGDNKSFFLFLELIIYMQIPAGGR
jgi:hypothetical protein